MNLAPDPEALTQLACQALQHNELEAAEAKCLQALDVDRQHAGAWTVLGAILQEKGRHEDAIRVFNSLTLRQPNVAGHWLNLGGSLRSAKRYKEALQAYERAVALDGTTPALLYNMGLIFLELLDYESAYAVLRQAADRAPKDAWIQCTLARCCYDLGNSEETLAALAAWSTFEGLTPDNVAEIASLLLSIGEAEWAKPAIDRLLQRPPEGGRAAVTLSNILERLNRLDEAHATLKRAKANPRTDVADPDFLLMEATLSQREDRDEHAHELLSRALQVQMEAALRHHLLFPIAKSLDAMGRYDEAFGALTEAHASQLIYLQKLLGKTPADGSPALALAARGVEPDDLARWDERRAPSAAQSPIFIVGFPRSGTTLLEQTLDSHPLIKSMDEQPFLKRAADEVTALGIAYPHELGQLSDDQLQSIREQYWAQVAKKVALLPEQRLVDKNPLNMLRLPLIHRLFPHARTILAIRHPCDTLISCFAQQFRAPELAMLCRDLPTLANAYRIIFDFWYQQAPLLPARTIELSYETLVADFATQVRRLAAFLDLPWDDVMLAPAKHALAKGFISTPSYTQVVQPINAQSIGRWRGYRHHFEAVLPVLEPHLNRWGYEV